MSMYSKTPERDLEDTWTWVYGLIIIEDKTCCQSHGLLGVNCSILPEKKQYQTLLPKVPQLHSEKCDTQTHEICLH